MGRRGDGRETGTRERELRGETAGRLVHKRQLRGRRQGDCTREMAEGGDGRETVQERGPKGETAGRLYKREGRRGRRQGDWYKGEGRGGDGREIV